MTCPTWAAVCPLRRSISDEVLCVALGDMSVRELHRNLLSPSPLTIPTLTSHDHHHSCTLSGMYAREGTKVESVFRTARKEGCCGS